MVQKDLTIVQVRRFSRHPNAHLRPNLVSNAARPIVLIRRRVGIRSTLALKHFLMHCRRLRPVLIRDLRPKFWNMLLKQLLNWSLRIINWNSAWLCQAPHIWRRGSPTKRNKRVLFVKCVNRSCAYSPLDWSGKEQKHGQLIPVLL